MCLRLKDHTLKYPFSTKVSEVRPSKAVLWRCFTFLGERGEVITEAVSWDSLLLAGFGSQVPLGFKGAEKQGRFGWMGLFVGTAHLNACHSLTDRLGSAESPIGVNQRSCQISSQTRKYTDTYFGVLPQLTWTFNILICTICEHAVKLFCCQVLQLHFCLLLTLYCDHLSDKPV